MLSEGTSIPDPAPVRPRSARLFEPCFDSNGFSDAPLALAALLTDIPVDILDEDSDGQDDGGPETIGGECNRTYSNAAGLAEVPGSPGADIAVRVAFYSTNTCNLIQFRDANNSTGGGVGNYTYGEVGLSTVTINGSAAGRIAPDVSLTVPTKPQIAGDGLQTSMILVCNNTATNVKTTPQSYGASVPSAISWIDPTCPSGTTPYAIVAVSARLAAGCSVSCAYPGGYGVLWRSDGTLPGPSQGGTAYYGGTQGAHYTFGADTSFGGVTDNGSIVCSANYDGSAPVTHALKNTPHGSWTNIDRSEEPPVLVDGVASEWSAKVLYYPTNTLTGGVYASNCKFLVSVTIWICSYAAHSPMEYGCIQMVWDAERYRSQQPYFGTDAESPETAICTIFPNTPGCYEVLNPEALEAPIVCLIEAEGEFFTWIITWIGNLPGWVGCMFTPEGWDRSGKMTRTWELGAAGQMQQAFYDSMPSGIGCGMIGQIPFEGQVLTINTCDADFAPGWVKITLGWILVLGLGALAIKRILWSIGGNK